MGMHKFLTKSRIRPLALCLVAILAGFGVLISTVPGAQAANPSGWNIITTPATGIVEPGDGHRLRQRLGVLGGGRLL